MKFGNDHLIFNDGPLNIRWVIFCHFKINTPSPLPPASMDSSSYTKASIAFFSTDTFSYDVPLIVPEIDHKFVL